jgi:hypothetical protein
MLPTFENYKTYKGIIDDFNKHGMTTDYFHKISRQYQLRIKKYADSEIIERREDCILIGIHIPDAIEHDELDVKLCRSCSISHMPINSSTVYLMKNLYILSHNKQI